jgi:hypothetical protein
MMIIRHTLSALALALCSAGASAAFSDDFTSGLSGWTAGGDVVAAGGVAVLTTASATFEDDIGESLNLSGTDPLIVGDAGGLEDFTGVAIGSLDPDIEANATEGSALRRSFAVQAGERFSFDWNLATLDTDPGLAKDYAFVVIEGQRFDLGRAADAQQAAASPYAAQTGWMHFEYVFAQAGNVNIAFGVVDVTDYSVSSRLSLDNVSISAVPEPHAYALLLAGLGLAGFAARRRA